MKTSVFAFGTRRAQRAHAVVLLALAASIVGSGVAAAIVGGFRINLTPSEPLGLWRIVALDRPAAAGDLVFICPPQTAVMMAARERGYLRSGTCPGGVAPLIKTVVAVPGQHVQIGARVTIDGHPIPFSDLAERDGNGRSMKPFPGGVVPDESVFLHSPFRSSYDSRYFGPLPASGILGLAQPVLTYAP
ncbi:conjugative transfer signal peptidase TraF [Rhizobium sophorae]|uniref:Conjugative transfer signal peptidase TraF n=4 Tax=Rhizobium TaxID=379 RepID=A0A246DRD6_9HYPH|nr:MULTISPECIES: conjugative transfer signal peptidase TraF [Rhizobium]MDR9774814.1 conjugative transfer signal peptidase TraF [Rhizobium hidalgonense]NNU41118.1 conjugative transfer signal peptidase TraF [Rhizobium sophorae]OWO92901.1 conjugative transfer signal peptidase TraF [Rhizobium esperanzae]PCK77782.1 conjugative transfer signal peptidase TraF [Rhizobium sophoriradicis]PCK84517.1 conjugative transfer signal peptidase TraF [Rhizobium sophoriradicis]